MRDTNGRTGCRIDAESESLSGSGIGIAIGIGIGFDVGATGMTFGHEQLDVYRAAVEYVGWAFRLCEQLKAHRNAKEQLLRASKAISIAIPIPTTISNRPGSCSKTSYLSAYGASPASMRRLQWRSIPSHCTMPAVGEGYFVVFAGEILQTPDHLRGEGN
jgi:hypothetical protein